MKKKSFLISLGLFFIFYSCKELNNTDYSGRSSTIQATIMGGYPKEESLQSIRQVNRHLNRYTLIFRSKKKYNLKMNQAINDLARKINASGLKSDRLPLMEKSDVSKNVWIVGQIVESLTSLLEHPKSNADLIKLIVEIGEGERGRVRMKRGVNKGGNLLFDKDKLRNKTNVLMELFSLFSLKDILYSLRGTLKNIDPLDSICEKIIFEIDLISKEKECNLVKSLSRIKLLLGLLIDTNKNKGGSLHFSTWLKKRLIIRDDENSDISSDDDFSDISSGDDFSDKQESLDSDSDDNMDIEEETKNLKDKAQTQQIQQIQQEESIRREEDIPMEDLIADFENKIRMGGKTKEGIPSSKAEQALDRLHNTYNAIDSMNL